MNKDLKLKIDFELVRLIEKRELSAIVALDELLKRHREELPEDLQHYLSRRSYEKALGFLRGTVTRHTP